MFIENRFFEIIFQKRKRRDYDDYANNISFYQEWPIFSFDAYFINDFFFRLPSYQENNKHRRKKFIIAFKFLRNYYFHFQIKLWKLNA